VGNGHIFKSNVELLSSLGEFIADSVGDRFSLGDEFGGVELGDDSFEDFVTD
jgi:hypothetical protein